MTREEKDELYFLRNEKYIYIKALDEKRKEIAALKEMVAKLEGEMGGRDGK